MNGNRKGTHRRKETPSFELVSDEGLIALMVEDKTERPVPVSRTTSINAPPSKPTIKVKAERAIAKLHDSAFAAALPGDPEWSKASAEMARKEAAELLDPGELIAGAGEKVPAEDQDSAGWQIIETLKDPNSISVAASHERMRLAQEVGILPMAIDAAESIGARNSLEKMLAHQLGALHRAYMNVMERAINDRLPNGLDPRLPIGDCVRLLSVGAKLAETYQNGLTTLHRIRTGGKQTVVVQHVQVTDGGQAVIAGSMKTGGTQGGEGGGNE
jgi:hypothetical protein